MKSIFATLTLLLWMGMAMAQTPCEELIQQAVASIQTGDYPRAVRQLLALQTHCEDPTDQARIRELIEQTTDRQYELQRSAIQNAEAAQQALEELARQQRVTDSTLRVANDIIDKMYFYQDKFGLTQKNIGSEYDPIFRYGFIDKTGKEVISFRFEEATPFSYQDGYARVEQEGKRYLLDTQGNPYLLAESLTELTPEIEALDLHNQPLDLLPDSVCEFTKLKIILLYHWGGGGS